MSNVPLPPLTRQGPVTHAFVIGGGSYPEAKPNRGALADLRSVPDIPSAADSAKLFCDWLITNQNVLSAPLASLEVLIGNAAYHQGDKPYPWANAHPVDEPTLANVESAGKEWVRRLTNNPGDVALFYGCGHGARLGSDPILFLSDLNADPNDPWGAHLNVGQTATAFKQIVPIRSAFFFLDACQEFSPQLALTRTRGGAWFVPPYDPFRLTEAREKVALLCATSDGRLAYEGESETDRQVKIGRFTETLLRALDGASVRRRDGRWVVNSTSLIEDLKPLHRSVRPDWRDKPFGPTLQLTPNEIFPITEPRTPRVPVLIRTKPEARIADFDVCIYANPCCTPPIMAAQQARTRAEWLAWVPASQAPNYAAAENGTAVHEELFVPVNPVFDTWIQIP